MTPTQSALKGVAADLLVAGWGREDGRERLDMALARQHASAEVKNARAELFIHVVLAVVVVAALVASHFSIIEIDETDAKHVFYSVIAILGYSFVKIPLAVARLWREQAYAASLIRD
jgi:hypothetical protein